MTIHAKLVIQGLMLVPAVLYMAIGEPVAGSVWMVGSILYGELARL